MADTEGAVRIVIAGGGTGGHLYPGIALAQEFQRRREAQIMFIGTARGIENRVLPKLPYGFTKIWMRGLQRNAVFANLLFPVRLLVSFFQCIGAFRRFKPQVVIGTGGYVSGPALIAALASRIPTAIQEQNSYPGLVNRILGKRVSQVHLTYEESKRYFFGQQNLFVSGNPVRDLSDSNRKTALRTFELQDRNTTLFVFGGSQGAHAINQIMMECLERILQVPNLQVLWATGPADHEDTAEKCQAHRQRISLHAYIEDMAAAYAAADFVICRAGASTLSEITTCGLPSILIPYPFATAAHQDYNAKTLEQEGAAVMLLQRDLTHDSFVEIVTELATNAKKRRAMSEAARKLARPNAAADIVDKIEELLV